MKKNLSNMRFTILLSAIPILFLGLFLLNASSNNSVQKNEVMHTYLVKIPNDAGVCPYALMSKSNGKLKMLDDSHCVCPFTQHAFYMTTRSKDVKSVMAMLPEVLQNKVQIKMIDNLNNQKKNEFKKSFASASF